VTRKTFLVGGIVAATLYVAMTLFVGVLWDGYSVTSQAPSELAAIGAPTRVLWMVLGTIYSALMIGFGLALYLSARRHRALRIVGLLLAGQAVFGAFWPPMHQRAVLAAGGGTLTDTLHLVWAAVSGLAFTLAMGFGAAAYGKRFRAYSLATLAVALVCAAVTGTYAARVQADLPTPWLGVWERISIAAFMAWVAALAATRLRGEPYGRAGQEHVEAAFRIRGHLSPGFDAVRAAFAANFSRRDELGGACCVYRAGEAVVDLWGGSRNERTGEPWERDTMVVVHSASKGLAAMTLALAHSRGWLDYERPVCEYWPEFAQHGKERVTVRQLLGHQAGLFAIDEPVDRRVLADLDQLAVVLARQKPAWPAGTRQAYHGLTLGFYEGELLRRIDPQHRSLGRFFAEEIAAPLGLDLYLRLPETVANERLAPTKRSGTRSVIAAWPGKCSRR
jgi:hypothetical protein